MPLTDVFNQNAFKCASLTAALNKVPFKPQWLGDLGLFTKRSINTNIAIIEEKLGRLSLVPNTARGTYGADGGTNLRSQRKARSFTVPHLVQTEAVLADDVLNVRAFGSETELEALSNLILERQLAMRGNIEVTKEYHRAGAIQGLVYDSDGSTPIYNYFTEFSISETVKDFAFTTSTTDIKAVCTSVIRAIEDALGATMFNGVVGLCGQTFFDSLTGHTVVKTAYDRWMDGEFLRTLQRGGGGFVGPGGRQGFDYGGITFVDYGRQAIGSTKFVSDSVCRFFPVGALDVFQEIYAPADYNEAAGTLGQEFYSKIHPMPFDKGNLLEVQSNPLMICTRPAALIKGTMS